MPNEGQRGQQLKHDNNKCKDNSLNANSVNNNISSSQKFIQKQYIK